MSYVTGLENTIQETHTHKTTQKQKTPPTKAILRSKNPAGANQLISNYTTRIYSDKDILVFVLA